MTQSLRVDDSNAGQVMTERPPNAELTWTRPQFGLAGLFVLTAVLAVGLVLLKYLGHWGLVLMTAASFVYMAFQRIRPSPKQHAIQDVLWGIGLPLLCFTYDPGIFRPREQHSLLGEIVLCLALWQMGLLTAWLLGGPRGLTWNHFLAGGLLFGVILSGLISIPLTLLAALGSLVLGAGLPGFVPLMTHFTLRRNLSLLLQRKGGAVLGNRWEILGFVVAIVVPLLIVAVAHHFGWAIELPRVAGMTLQVFDD